MKPFQRTLVFAAYGAGAKPIFEYPTELKTPATERILFNLLGDYIIIDGLNITDLHCPLKDNLTPANCGIAISIGSTENVISNHCIMRNCDMSNIGMGIVIYGNSNVVHSCP